MQSAFEFIIKSKQLPVSVEFSFSYQSTNLPLYGTSLQIVIPEVRLDTFLAFLEYLYTDHSPIENSDSIGILELGNQYVMPRLTALCELYISKHVERATSDSIAQSDINIIGRDIDNTQWLIHVVSYCLS